MEFVYVTATPIREGICAQYWATYDLNGEVAEYGQPNTYDLWNCPCAYGEDVLEDSLLLDISRLSTEDIDSIYTAIMEHYSIDDSDFVTNIQIIYPEDSEYNLRDIHTRTQAVLGVEDGVEFSITHTACLEALYGLTDDLETLRTNMYSALRENDRFFIGHTVEGGYWYVSIHGNSATLYAPLEYDSVLVETIDGLDESTIASMCRTYGNVLFPK